MLRGLAVRRGYDFAIGKCKASSRQPRREDPEDVLRYFGTFFGFIGDAMPVVRLATGKRPVWV